MNKPQVELLYEHLVFGPGSISPEEAHFMYRVNSFHRRMADLVNMGLTFHKARKKDASGRPYVRYYYTGLNLRPAA